MKNSSRSKFKEFIHNFSTDERIPQKDKKILLALLFLIISPVDFIPDWIKIYGILDDLIYLSLFCDYLFDVLDQRIFLSHFPWSMKNYSRVRKIGNIFSFFVPNMIKDHIWEYKQDPY